MSDEFDVAQIRARNEASVSIEIDDEALTAAHLAVEDQLIEMRDARLSVVGPRNGLVVNEKDGEPSPIMRLGTRQGLQVGIQAYLAAVNEKKES